MNIRPVLTKKKSIFSAKLHVFVFIVLIIFIFSNFIYAQYEKPLSKQRIQNPKNYNQVQASILKANRYESLSEFGKAYNLYRNLVRTNSDDPDVLNGYVRNSVKTKKIKECEIKLKTLISKSKKSETDPEILEILLESFLGQLFLMTDRDMQGNEIIKLINASNISSKLKYAIKGRMYYESSSYKNAIDQYMKVRKELKDNDLFSKELFKTYKSANMISEVTNELVSIFLKEDKKLNREKRFDVFSAKHEMIKLFELEENSNVMLNVVADRSKKDKNLNNLLSELYFMNKDYENAFLALKQLDIEKNELSVIISFATKLFKEKDYKNSANFYSLYFTENRQIQKKELKQYFLYIDALVKLGQFENSIKKLSSLDLPEAEIKLAYINHLSGNWKKAKKIYEKQIDILKGSPNEFIDYLILLISLEDYSKSQKVINKALKNADYHSLRREVEDQLLYLDFLLSILQQNKEEFLIKYDKLTKDNIISDTDNNIIKIKNELNLIGDDKKLLSSYLDYLSYQIDSTNKYEDIPIEAEDIEDKAKKLFVLKLNYCYLKASKNNLGQSNIIKLILDEKPSGSEIGSLILDYCDNKDITQEEKNEILMELLKGEFSSLIKSKARKIIRQK
jgi:tetratricopeptide (TPR) repeat protein